MTDREAKKEVDWPTCAEPDCNGVVVNDGRCFGHLSDDDVVRTIRAQSDWASIDARGVRIGWSLLHRLLTASHDSDRPPRDLHFERALFTQKTTLFWGDYSFGWVHLDGATFAGDVSFGGNLTIGNLDVWGTSIPGDLRLSDVTIQEDFHFNDASIGSMRLAGCHLQGDLTLLDTHSAGDVLFFETDIGGNLYWSTVTVEGGLTIMNSTIRGSTGLHDLTVSESLKLQDSTFRDRLEIADANMESFDWSGTSEADVNIMGLKVRGKAEFLDVRCSADTYIRHNTFRGGLTFVNCLFSKVQFGPWLIPGDVVLRDVSFDARASITMSAKRVTCTAVRYTEGANLSISAGAELALEENEFGRPSVVAGLPVSATELTSPSFAVDQFSAFLEKLAASDQAHLVSLRRSDVGQLTIAGMDIKRCLFYGSHNLDRLRVDSGCTFAGTPRFRYTRRLSLAEEHKWRAAGRRRHRVSGWLVRRMNLKGLPQWYPEEVRSPSWLEKSDRVLAPNQIATLYRSLRKGLEDNRDEPGAADFYYGEMEMRRHSAKDASPNARIPSRSERLVLWFYWLTAGYGLRASRALICLGLTIMAFAVLLDFWGFRPDQSFARAVLFSIESTSSLFRIPPTPDAELTYSGEAFQIVLRLLGPLFLGLALLSLRGRVKR